MDTIFEIFKYMNDKEHDRYAHLVTRANIFLSIEVLFFGSLFFRLKDVLNIAKKCPISSAMFMIAILLHLVALIFIILSLRIYAYEDLFDPEKALLEMDQTGVNPNAFIRARLVDIAAALKTNKGINSRKAYLIATASYFILAGLAATSLFLIAAILA